MQSKFTRRGLLLFSLLEALMVRRELQTTWVRPALVEMLRQQPHSEPLHVVSVGGGPGTDASGLVFANRRLFGDHAVACHLLDFEATWRRYTKTLNELFAPSISVDFDRCDVTQSLARPGNAAAKKLASQADLFVFAYVCNETWHKAQAAGLAFYRDVMAQARPGALFLFMDVHKHSAGTLAGIQAAMLQTADCRVWVPPHESFSHAALHQPCELLVLQKTLSLPLRAPLLVVAESGVGRLGYPAADHNAES